MNDALVIYNQFEEMQRAAMALHKSGFFPDVKSQAQAIVKVMAGAELGVPPFASMTGINIIKGKPTLGANVLATLVKNDPRYDYKVVSKPANDHQVCLLDWYENGEKVGQSTFTIEEAKTAGLLAKDNWKKYPSDMLFARAISRGVRRYAPGVFSGSPVYTPDEMGAEVDDEGSVIVDSVATDVVEETEIQPKQDTNGNRPYSPEVVRDKIVEVSEFPQFKKAKANDAQRGLLRYGLELCFAGDKEAEDKRHTVLDYIAGTPSTKDVSGAVLKAILDKWLKITKDEDSGDYSIDPMAAKEAQKIFTTALADEGQQALL
ncbi:MAG: hypothetical protein ACYSW6_11745 [Planctomycetota bacterium]|jgi:hypothetical protein